MTNYLDLFFKNTPIFSLSIIYGAFTAGNLVSAPIVEILGARRAMLIASLFYTIFQCGFFFLNPYFLYTSSITQGLGAASKKKTVVFAKNAKS